MQMPVMGGEEAITLIRQAGNQTPITVLTANAMKQEKDKCFKLGANAFLAKPIDKEKFYFTLAQYLKPVARESSSNIHQKALDDCTDIQDLVEEFVYQLPLRLNEIQQAMNEEDWNLFRSLLHSLKGVGGSFGHPRITELCQIIEEQHDATNLIGIENSLIQLKEYCNQAVVAYQAIPQF